MEAAREEEYFRRKVRLVTEVLLSPERKHNSIASYHRYRLSHIIFSVLNEQQWKPGSNSEKVPFDLNMKMVWK